MNSRKVVGTEVKTAMLVFALAGSSCLIPVDVSLGSLDGGAAGGTATGGGMATGGGAAIGGGTAGGGAGGGVPSLPDAGLVTPLLALDAANCGRVRELLEPCVADAGSCFALLRPGQSEVNIVVLEDILPDTYWSAIGPASGGFVFGSTADSEPFESSLWYARAGSAPRKLQSGPRLRGIATADQPNYGFWYVAETQDPGVSRNLMLVAGLASGGAPVPVASNLPEPTSNAVAVGTDYLVAFHDGLHSYYAAGGGLVSPLVSVSGGSERIVHIAADATDVVFLQCTTDFPYECALKSYARQGNSVAATLISRVELLIGRSSIHTGFSVTLLGPHAYVLGVQNLLRIPRSGGTIERVYAGESFPQNGGTLRGESLKNIAGKLYFGSVCYFDADAPGYAAVELDPATATARWLELDPTWPFVPHLETRVSNGLNAWPSDQGVFRSR